MIHVAASLGSAVYTGCSERAETMLARASTAAHTGQHRESNAYRRYKPRMRIEPLRQLTLGPQIATGLSRAEFYPLFQPIAETASHRVVGAEVLSRWRRPSKKKVSPETFIGIAEGLGLIGELTEVVIRQALRLAAAWPLHEEGPRLSVNISPAQFRDSTVVAMLDRLAAEQSFDPNRIQIEITESLLMDQGWSTIASLQALRERGYRIALDDFGKGYSSIGYLAVLPVDTIKIDKLFVQDVSRGSKQARLLQSIVSMVRDIGASTVAEGVETPEELDVVQELGATHYQGFLLSRPLDGSSFALRV